MPRSLPSGNGSGGLERRGGWVSQLKLLIVEDDEGLCTQYRWAFPDHQLLVAHDRQTARAIIARERPMVGILDLGLPPDRDGASEGLAMLQEALALVPDAKLIVATGNVNLDYAVQAVAIGAFDFYQKPIDIDVLRIIVSRAYTLYRLEEENRRLRAQVGSS